MPFELLRSYTVVTVAQLVERWIVIPVVGGSIPLSHPIFSLKISVLALKN